MRITLTVETGPHAGKVFTFTGHDMFLVGRSRNAHCRFDRQDMYFSRVHFMVEVNPPLCRILDAGSRNGTFVNGQRVQSAELRHGDLIRAGHTTLRVALLAGEETTAPPVAAPAGMTVQPGPTPPPARPVPAPPPVAVPPPPPPAPVPLPPAPAAEPTARPVPASVPSAPVPPPVPLPVPVSLPAARTAPPVAVAPPPVVLAPLPPAEPTPEPVPPGHISITGLPPLPVRTTPVCPACSGPLDR